MRILPEMQEKWASGDYTGRNRPVVRATIQRCWMSLTEFNLRSTYSIKKPSATGIPSAAEGPVYDLKNGTPVKDAYASFLFGNLALSSTPVELPNIVRVGWNRSIDSDAADMTMVLRNAWPLAPGQQQDRMRLDRVGYFTPTRGDAAHSSSWGYSKNEWHDLLLPDQTIRCYEGYGCDVTKIPEEDPNLTLTGTWIIDNIRLMAGGEISIACRDMGRLLLDCEIMKGIIPDAFYPLSFSGWDSKVQIGNSTPGRKKISARISDTSNTTWIGAGGSVGGHEPAHAMDGKPETFWLSIGNDAPSRRYAYEWVEVAVSSAEVSEVRFRSKKAGYNAYVSVYSGGAWRGSNMIDYHRDGVGHNGSNIHYVAMQRVGGENEQKISFSPVKGVTRVRLTFGNLQYFQGGTYHYRAGIREMAVYGVQGSAGPTYGALTPGPEGANPGYYRDYSFIIELLCAWAGFYWPKGAHVKLSNGTQRVCTFGKDESDILGHGVQGRVWGDFQRTGTVGPATLEVSNFDKKSVMEALKYIKGILGFHLAIDESGGVQWRMPNVFSKGNWVILSESGGRTSSTLTLDEAVNLLSYDATLSSANVREKNIVSDASGKFGSAVPGFNPNPCGMRRAGMWTDKNFSSSEETRTMAEMISIRQMFTYRTGSWRIPGFPGLQIDDQVRIVERETGEDYLHYVKSISSELDMVAGTWFYSGQSFWLGEDPGGKWMITRSHISAMSEGTQALIDHTTDADPGFSGRSIP